MSQWPKDFFICENMMMHYLSTRIFLTVMYAYNPMTSRNVMKLSLKYTLDF